MCGRYTNTRDLETLAQEFSLASIESDLKPSYNIAPTQRVPVLITKDDALSLVTMRWGLVPSWAKDAAIGNKMINARAETLAEKPSFRNLIGRKRCALVADGFYEWRSEGNAKTPYYIRLKSQEPFAFAGLYDIWQSPENETLTTCTLITTAANELMEPIHHRMPVIFSKSEVGAWLDAGETDKAQLLTLLRPYPSAAMEAYAVSRLVNAPQNNSPNCIRPQGG